MDLIYTIFCDIVFSLKLTRPLEFLALFVVIMLLSSPGGAATIVGVGTKLGIWSFLKERK